MATERPVQTEPYPAEKARGRTIILRKPWQRIVFIFGLAAAPILLLLLLVLRWQ